MRKWKLPRLSRGGKILRNLGAAVLLAVLAWGFTEFRLLDPYLDFRRAERANWAGPSEIQGVFQTKYDRWAVGTCGDQVLLQIDHDRGFSYWPRKEAETTLVPVPDRRMGQGDIWVAAVDVPEGTAAARLGLTVSFWYSVLREKDAVHIQYSAGREMGEWKFGAPTQWKKTYDIPGELLKDGGVVFHAAPEDEEDDVEQSALSDTCDWQIWYTADRDWRPINCAMEAVFYDEAGGELGRAALRTPG